MDYPNREIAEEGKKKRPSLWSVSGMVLSIAGIMSAPSRSVPSKPKSNASMLQPPADNPPRAYQAAESRHHQDNPTRDVSRYDKSVFELIKSDAKQYRRELNAIGIVLFAISAFLFYNYMKAGIVILSLMAMGALSRAWQRFFPLEFGIELVMLATVISGVAYGAMAGAVVGVVSLVASTLLTQEDPGKMWPAFATIVLIGFLAGTIPIANIALWGVIFTAAYDAVISVIYISMGFSIVKTLIFDATHIAFNYFVFYNVAPLLASAVL